MAYMPVDQKLARHRKTIALAAELGRDVHRWQAAGLLIDIWDWAIDQAKDGRIDVEIHREALAKHLGTRSGYIEKTITALRKIGWIDPDGRLHEWDEWGGKVVKAREEDAHRKRLWREHIKGLHSEKVAGCRPCARMRPGGRGGSRPADGPSDADKKEQPRPADASESVQRTPDDASRGIRARASTEERSKNPLTPSDVSGQDAMVDRARQVLEGATEPWRSALQQLLLAEVTSTQLVQWFAGTRLHGDATVIAPNGFVRDHLVDPKYGWGRRVAAVLGVERVRFCLESELDEPDIPEEVAS